MNDDERQVAAVTMLHSRALPCNRSTTGALGVTEALRLLPLTPLAMTG